MKTKIEARYVVGYDGADHIVYEDGEVIFEDDRILSIGNASLLEADRIIMAGNAIVSPGFIDLDALVDIDHAILDCWVPPYNAAGLEWSESYFNSPRKELFGPEEEACRRRYGFIQLIMNGITTALPIAGEYHREWAETFDEFAAVADVAAELGIRTYLGPSYRSGVTVTHSDGTPDVFWDEQRGVEGLAGAVRFVKQFDGAYGGLIKGLLAPARIQTCTLELLRESKRYSDELGCPIRLHACQGQEEIHLLGKWYDKTPLTLLHEIGFLGPSTLLPHATHILGHNRTLAGTGDELPLLGNSGTTVVHCPVIEARYGVALDSFEKYAHAGVNLGLGTDTFPPDMIRVMDLGWNINKIMEGNQWSSSAADFFRAATLGGAKALGRDDLGRLTPGAKADLIIIDLDHLKSGPIEDPIRTLLLHTTGSSIRTSIIDGRVVMENWVIPGVDAEAVRQQGQRYFDRMKQAYSERDYLQRTPEELFPSELRVTSSCARSG